MTPLHNKLIHLKKIIQNSLLLITIYIVFHCMVNCAAEGGPSGGPKDEDGPVFISSIPKNGEVNVSNKINIQLDFSEMIDVRSVENSLNIFPSLSVKPKIKVKKNIVTISFQDTLCDNTTYIFSFGRNIKDYRKNNTPNEIKVAFSTGEKIDQNIIRGQIFGKTDEKKPINILLTAYVNVII